MRENNIYEVVGNADENLYEITYPYGLNIYEQVDSLDPNKDQSKENICRRLRLSLKVLLMTVSVIIGILIVVLCPILIFSRTDVVIVTSDVYNNSENITTRPESFLTKAELPDDISGSNEIQFSSRLTSETTDKTSVKSKSTQTTSSPAITTLRSSRTKSPSEKSYQEHGVNKY